MAAGKSRRTTKGKHATRAQGVERLPPTADAARDEGPRLLPLGDRVSEPSRLDHYLDLADAALGLSSGTRGSSATQQRETDQKKGTSV